MLAEDGEKPAETGPCRCSTRRLREDVRLFEAVLQAMVDDDELHPDVERLYAALCEAETRAAAAERRGG